MVDLHILILSHRKLSIGERPDVPRWFRDGGWALSYLIITMTRLHIMIGVNCYCKAFTCSTAAITVSSAIAWGLSEVNADIYFTITGS